MPGSGEDRYQHVNVSEGGSRKRRKMDRDRDSRSMSNTPADAIVLSSDAAVKTEPESGPSLPLQTIKTEQNGDHTHGDNCQHEASLRTIQTDLEAMRQLITCKICLRFLYEPYALTCGHTYCYGCIMNWMGNDAAQRKKTCPDCRTVIREQPAPSYLIKEMVLIFSGRNELLPDGETIEEHHDMAREEAEVVAKDKANNDKDTGGLFQGSFKRGGRNNPILAIRDDSDNVYRCPNCATEIEEGWCGPCGIRVVTDEDLDDMSDDDSDSMDSDLDPHSDIDHELDAELREDELAFGYEGHGNESGWSDEDDEPDDNGRPQWHLPEAFETYGGPIPFSADDSDAFSESDDTNHSLDRFIDDQVRYEDDADEDGDESDTSAATPVAAGRRRGRAIVLSDDEDEDEDDNDEVLPTRRARVQSEGASSAGASRDPEASELDEEESEAAASPQQRGIHGRRRYQVDSEIDDDDEVDEDGFDGDNPPPSDDEAQINLANHFAIHGYSPDAFNTDEELEEDGIGYSGATDHIYSRYEDEDDQSEAVGGISERAEDSDEDGEGDESDDMHSTVYGFVHASRRVLSSGDGLTSLTGTRATSAHDTYRLGTLQPRRNRHVSPSRNHAFPTRSATRGGRLGRTTGGPENGAGTSSMFSHPFQLSSTLDRLNTLHRISTSDRRQDNHRRSSQSSAGGVAVRGSSSGSGSSRTLRGISEDDGPRRARVNRRRQNVVNLDDSD